MTDDVFLDMDLAVARFAEELHRVTASGPSPLRDVVYRAEAAVLWRWVDASEDADVWAFVRAYTSAADRERVRSSLTISDFHTLITFARRCVLAALRNEDPGAAEAAFDALSAINLDRLDWHDVVVTANLASYAARRVGLEPDEMMSGPVLRSTEAVGEILEQAITKESDLPGDWGYREVATAAGPVLVESDGSPVSDDLLARAVAVAELVATDGTYTVDSISEKAGLSLAWVGDDQDTTAAVRRLSGCVCVYAEPPENGTYFLWLYLGEAENEWDARVIAEAAQRGSADRTAQLGIVVGPQWAVVVARPSTGDQPPFEDPGSLARFEGPISALLGRPPTPVQELAVQIYLESPDGAAAVDRSVLDVLREMNAEVGVRPPPVIGSWFRTFKARSKKAVESDRLSDLALRLERALEIQTLHGPQAQIDAAEAGAAADLIRSLEGQKNALVQIGSLLLIKLDGDLVVRNLTQRELAFIQRNPSSTANARKILEQLQGLGAEEARTAPITETINARIPAGPPETMVKHAALTGRGWTLEGCHSLTVTNSGKVPIRNVRAVIEESEDQHDLHILEDNMPVSQILPGQSATLNVAGKDDSNQVSIILRGEGPLGEAVECAIKVRF